MAITATSTTDEVELSTQDDRVIGSFQGDSSGPTLIVIGGLHGNEPAGRSALIDIARDLRPVSKKLGGRAYFLAGNIRALKAGKRFIERDLNRSWTPENMSAAGSDGFLGTSECLELTELDQILDSILVTALDEVFVLDLHSTSSDGMPFAMIGDTLRNRRFALNFPVPILLGIEEQLDGTVLEYLNNMGAVTLGFEGGQHSSDQTLENHKAMIWLALKSSGILESSDLEIAKCKSTLASGNHSGNIYEIRYRHAINPGDEFVMLPGFSSFDHVKKGDNLARDKRGVVLAKESGLVIMPLYQSQGEDGFFLGRRISRFWLWLSGLLRRLGVQEIVHLLPGVRRDPCDTASVKVNTRLARLFPLQIFHLLGFRRLRWVGKQLVVSRRRYDTAGPFKRKDR